MAEANALDIVIDALRSEVAGRAPKVAEASISVVREAAALARQNKVLSLVQRRLIVSAERASYLAEVATTMATNSALLDALCMVAQELASSNVAFVAIKGPLQQRLFHGGFFQRPAADLDLLVRPQHYEQAKRGLVHAGYRSTTPSVWWRGVLGEEHLRHRAPPYIAVDLHHRVHQPGTPAPLDGEILFENIVEVDVRGAKIPTLNASGGLLLCTISIAKALYNREPVAAYLCDLYAGLMAAAPDAVNGFFTMARRAGLGGHAAVALRLMSALFEVPFALPRSNDAFGDLGDADLCRIALLPRDPVTVWPKRRTILWQLCEQRPFRYGGELARMIRSEVMRRAFERPLPI